MKSSLERVKGGSADILKTSGFQSLDVNEAMGKVRAALSKGQSSPRDTYAVIVYPREGVQPGPNYLKTVNTFLEAYWRGWRALSRLAIAHRDLKPDNIQILKDQEVGDVYIYRGSASAKDVQASIPTSPGVYMIVSHLDQPLLGSLGLPPIPEPFRESPLVMRVEVGTHVQQQEDLQWNPWRSLTRLITEEERANAEIRGNTLNWRTQFLADYESWSSAQIAEESTSTAKNRSAIASRWLAEGKIFSVRFGGKTWFPKFQFEHGNPLPGVEKVIKAFPQHATGWDLAFFLSTPNSYLRGRKPLELLKTDPEGVESLARSFASPADVF